MTQPVTLNQAIGEFTTYLAESGKSSKTLYTYGKDLEQIELFFGSEKLLDAITPQQTGRFLKSPELLSLKSGSDKSQITVDKTVRVYRQLLVWAMNRGYIKSLPLTKGVGVGHQKAVETLNP